MNTRPLESFKILLIGDSCDDVYHYGTADRLSPEAPVPVLKETRSEVKAGMSGNVYLNMLSFGLDTQHVTNRNKIEKHRFIDERYNQHLLRYDTGEIVALDPCSTPLLRLLKVDTDFDAVVISDYNKGFLSSLTCESICHIFKEQPIFVDTKKNNLSCFSNCVIKINEKEYNSVTNMPKDSEFVVTLGGRGAMYNDQLYPSQPIEVFDVCGAGDVFLASLVFGYLNTKSLSESIQMANKFAALSVSHMGTYVLTPEDIEKTL